MSKPPEISDRGQIAFYFNTNEPIPAAPLLVFISEVARIARTKRHFGPEALVEILEVRTGSKTIVLSINQKIALAAVAATALTAVAPIGSLALDVWDRMQKPDTRIAKCTATMMIEHGVVSAEVITCEGPLEALTKDRVDATKPRPETDQQSSAQRVFGDAALENSKSERDPKKVPLAIGHRDMNRLRTDAEQHVNLVGKFEAVKQADDGFEFTEYVFVTDAGRRIDVWGQGLGIELPVDVRLFVRGTLDYSSDNEVYLTPISVFKIDD